MEPVDLVLELHNLPLVAGPTGGPRTKPGCFTQRGLHDRHPAPIFVAEGGLIAQQARRLPKLKETDLAASDGVFGPDFIEAAGAENAEDMYVSAPDITRFRGNRFYQEEVLPA